MADNTKVLNPAAINAAGDNISTDDLGVAKAQRVKIITGASGVDGGNVSTANPFPVVGPITDAELRASSVPVSGAFYPATQPVSGPLTNAELRASDVPVSGPLTNSELRASDVPVSVRAFQPSSTMLDAFGRVRMSYPEVLGYGSSEYGYNSRYLEQLVSGTGVVGSAVNESSITLSTGGTASGAYAYVATKIHHRYTPGRSQLLRWTGSFATPISNVRQRAGYFDTRNGIFLEYDGTTLYFVRRTYTSGSIVDNRIARSSWSDPFDGTGPSGVNLDLAGGTTWLAWADLEWLGVGRYRFGFANPASGELITCYAAAGTNVLTVPYMSSASLPMRFEIQNTGIAASAKTLKWICYSIDTEGGGPGDIPLQFSADSFNTSQTAQNGALTPILAVRAKTTGPNSVPNRGQIIVKGTEGLVTGNTSCIFRTVLNPTTLTQNGGAITWTAAGDLSEYARFSAGASDTFAGGQTIDSFYVSASAQNKGNSPGGIYRKLPLVFTDLNSVQDTLVICAAGCGANSAVFSSMVWQEYY